MIGQGPPSPKRALKPAQAVLHALQDLCKDPRNVVFVVSGRGKEELEASFGHIKVRHDTHTTPIRPGSDGA